MRQITKRLTLCTFFLACLLTLSASAWAQENNEGGSGGETQSTTTTTSKSTDINITSGSDDWYMQPWVWIVGAAVFILLLIALLRTGRGRDTVSTSDRVTVKKTVERDGGTDI